MVSRYYPLDLMWDGQADIYNLTETKDETTKRMKKQLDLVHSAVPCRLSHLSFPAVSEQANAPAIAEAVKLFLPTDLDVSAGSEIHVTQNGRTQVFVATSEPAYFSKHQEVTLELKDRWA